MLHDDRQCTTMDKNEGKKETRDWEGKRHHIVNGEEQKNDPEGEWKCNRKMLENVEIVVGKL